jgi:hypothetical protein
MGRKDEGLRTKDFGTHPDHILYLSSAAIATGDWRAYKQFVATHPHRLRERIVESLEWCVAYFQAMHTPGK